MSSNINNIKSVYELIYQTCEQIYTEPGNEEEKSRKLADFVFEFSAEQLKMTLIEVQLKESEGCLLKNRVNDKVTGFESLTSVFKSAVYHQACVSIIKISLNAKLEIEDVALFCDYIRESKFVLALEVLKQMEMNQNPHASRARQIYTEQNR